MIKKYIKLIIFLIIEGMKELYENILKKKLPYYLFKKCFNV